MDVSIIIVNWNTRDQLETCLRTVAACSQNLAVQTIVVDNDSSDGSREMVSGNFPWVLLQNSGGNLGFARANNLALERASAPLILFLNPDTELREGALEKMVEFMRGNPSVGALGCKIRGGAGEVEELGLQWFPSPLTVLVDFLFVSRLTLRKFQRFLPYHDPDHSGYVNKLFGACLMVRQAVLAQVGSFDDRFFMYCEDVDLCRRIQVAGWKLYYLSEVEIVHWGATASAKAPGLFSVLMMCESFSKLMRKHHGALGSVGYRCIAFLGSQIRLLMLLFRKGASGLRGKADGSMQGSRRKYLAITRWALGLDKPLIRT